MTMDLEIEKKITAEKDTPEYYGQWLTYILQVQRDAWVFGYDFYLPEFIEKFCYFIRTGHKAIDPKTGRLNNDPK